MLFKSLYKDELAYLDEVLEGHKDEVTKLLCEAFEGREELLCDLQIGKDKHSTQDGSNNYIIRLRNTFVGYIFVDSAMEVSEYSLYFAVRDIRNTLARLDKEDVI